MLAAGRSLGGDCAVDDLPVADLILVLGTALHNPTVEVLPVEQARPLAVVSVGGCRKDRHGQGDGSK